MANVQVVQRHAHLASGVKLDFVNGRDGKVARAMVTAISNTRRSSGESREEESTAIQWTLWGKQAENAAEYLGKGSHVNIVGRLRNNNYTNIGRAAGGGATTAPGVSPTACVIRGDTCAASRCTVLLLTMTPTSASVSRISSQV